MGNSVAPMGVHTGGIPQLTTRMLKLPRLMKRRVVIDVPLFFTRQALYMFVIGFTVLAILLPVSVISYLNFYKMLIPTERVQLPLKFTDEHSNQTAHLNTASILPFLRMNSDLTFLVQLGLRGECTSSYPSGRLSYNFSMSSYEPATDSIFVNCDRRLVYVTKNLFVPYNLQDWVPPILVDIFQTFTIYESMITMDGSQLLKILSADPFTTLTFPRPYSFEISRSTTLDFVIEWDGIRYYMVKYRITSLIIGVFIFWSLSTFVCSLSLLYFAARFLGPPDKLDERPPMRVGQNGKVKVT